MARAVDRRHRLGNVLRTCLFRIFSRLNGGKIQIASRFGFYEFEGGAEIFRKMSADFPGTVVTIEINTADNAVYSLSAEATPQDVC